MIDLNLLRTNTEKIKSLILKKEPKFDIEKLIELDKSVRLVNAEIENLRKEKNELAAKGKQGVTQEIREKSIEIGSKLKQKEVDLIDIEKEFKKLALSCPNIPQEDIPAGNKESNQTAWEFGSKKIFDFKPKNHVELNEKLDWFDFDAATAMSGSNFIFYKKDSVKMIYALTNLMLKNNYAHGFEPVIPPYLVKEQALVNSSNLPKFEGDFYKMQDDLCLIPTAEVSLTNVHANQILNVSDLPKRYVAWTSCFRREAGGYGSTERGLIRIHQFEKVEIYSICKPEDSNEELVRMIKTAEKILQSLGLHYRVSLLAAQDCSFASSKTYDIEVWLPGQNQYYEVSSCSNCTDFQSRRAQIRFRKNADSKPELVHTLNSSALAIPRLMVAIIETYQQEDGSIKFPKVLQDAMDNLW
ncbi:serine--tRNA ligase [Candidatus Dependentiae bacterium]|nr:serine--tRNA ligase [Candidatus Dependentiae bacterium]MCG2755962.1 serine--tRNA ligase [Candidatus Dependentiae bacterium]